jgi:hypothetical protein
MGRWPDHTVRTIPASPVTKAIRSSFLRVFMFWFSGNWNRVGLRSARNSEWVTSCRIAVVALYHEVFSHNTKSEGWLVELEGRWAVEDRPPSSLAPGTGGSAR